jgi:LacI family transcriptional regulator
MAPRRAKTARQRARPATIADVARLAGVGLGTASRAMTGAGPVSDAARERVRSAATRLGFRPSPVARALRGKKPKLLGVVLTSLEPSSTEWLRGASEAAREHGYVLIVCDGQGSSRVTAEQLERLLGQGIDGLLLAGATAAPAQLRGFLDAGMPIGPAIASPRDAVASFERAWRPGITAACDALVDHGHRRFLCCVQASGDEDPTGVQRLWEVLLAKALARAGASAEDVAVVRVADAAAVAGKVSPLLERRDRPTAAIAGTPVLTPPLLATVAALGLEVPADLSFVSLEESVWEATYRPPLAVVRRDAYAAARITTRALIARIERWPVVEPASEPQPVFERRGSIGTAPRPRGRAPDALRRPSGRGGNVPPRTS